MDMLKFLQVQKLLGNADLNNFFWIVGNFFILLNYLLKLKLKQTF